MPELTEADIIALERRNYRRRMASTCLAGVAFVVVGFAIAWAWIEPTAPVRLTSPQACIVGAIAAVLIFGANLAFMLQFRPPKAAMIPRMKLLRADDLQRRAVRGLLWMCGFLVIGTFNSIPQLHRGHRPDWWSIMIYCGMMLFVVHGLVTGLGLDASNLAKPLDDEVTREHRRRALVRSYPYIIGTIIAAYLACANDASRVFWVFPLALTFSVLLPAGLFAFWELRASGGD